MQPDNIIAAIRDRLTALATAEAAMTEGPWYWDEQYHNPAGEPTHSLIGEGGYGVLSCDIGNAPGDKDATGIAALRNAAPGLLAGYSATVDTCEGWLLDEERLSMARRWTEEPDDPDALITGMEWTTKHDCALTILRGIAAALGVTTEVAE